MNAKQYVNAVVRKVKCSGKRKNEIRKQLLADINMRVSQGERIEEILSRMGTAAEIADGFNENITQEEQKQYSRNKALKAALLIVAVLAVLVFLLYRMIPRGADIEKSEYFDEEQVEAAMKETIELLDRKDYAALQKNAIPQMKSVLESGTMEDVRGRIAENWGKRIAFGKAYIGEIVQKRTHYAVGEITVSYENVSVTYRLTYDRDMRLAGLYVR